MVFPWGTLFVASLLLKRGVSKSELKAAAKSDNRRATAAKLREEEAQAAKERLEAMRHAELLSALQANNPPPQPSPVVIKSRRPATPLPKRQPILGDPFDTAINGRLPKRALLDLNDLLQQPSMAAAFKTASKRVHKSKSGPEIWIHPAGIYMAVPAIGAERIFSSIAAARDYHARCVRQR